MVNNIGKYDMEQKPMKPDEKSTLERTVKPRPNEQSALNIDEFLRISDPETKQVFVEQRA